MSAPAAYQVAPNVWRIPAAPFDFVNIYAFVDEDGQVTLVDTGLKSASKRTLAGLAAMGRSVVDVTRIVLTHAHGDHAGNAARLAELTAAPVSIHEVDAPFARDGSRRRVTPPLGRSLDESDGQARQRIPGRIGRRGVD